MKTLIINTQGAMGDLLLSTPIAEAIHRNFPGSSVFYWANPRFTPLLENHPYIQGVLDMPIKVPFGEGWRNLKSLGFDAVISPWSKSREAWMSAFARIPIRVGQGGRLSYSFLYTHPVTIKSLHGDTHTHWVDILLDYARALKCDVTGLRPFVTLAEAERAEGRAFWQSLPAPEKRPRVILQVCKGLPVTADRWPLDVFIQAGKTLIEQGCMIALTGLASEKHLMDEVEAKLDSASVINTAGRFALRQAAAFIAAADVVICPDTGTGHLGAALDVPVVSIFALKCEVPLRWHPFVTPYRIIRPDPIRCDLKCCKETCPRFSCLLDVDPASVAQAALEIAKKQ